jgi:hypothetical protein
LNFNGTAVKNKKSSHDVPRSSSSAQGELAASFARLSNLVPDGGDNECWYWLGAVNDRGYGIFRLGRRTVMAHRHMFEIEHGRPPAGMVLQSCGKKSCVNPRHLNEGTKPRPHDADASRLEQIDRAVLPPASPLRGTSGVNNPRAQLNEEQVRKICALLDRRVSPRIIAFEFGVDAKSIRNIDQGKT